MGQKLTTKDIRQVYFSEVKKSVIRRVARTVFITLIGVISIFLADAATNSDLDNTNPNFRH
ncbi:hypothetical protein ACKQTC_02520 [Peptococcus simiae]|uniref:Uncharacterized protein n=1 Tax=Peptococcus simiae TaxID=1643805 RepID=A0ABW9GYJ7_9FIRM